MTTFIRRRCFIHPSREAASLCVECRRSFCRECVVEHDGRLVCGPCLERLRPAASSGSRRFAGLASAASMVGAILLCWIAFYLAGRVLLLEEPVRHAFEDAAKGNASKP